MALVLSDGLHFLPFLYTNVIDTDVDYWRSSFVCFNLLLLLKKFMFLRVKVFVMDCQFWKVGILA